MLIFGKFVALHSPPPLIYNRSPFMGGVVGGWRVHHESMILGFESDFQAKNPSNTPTSGP